MKLAATGEGQRRLEEQETMFGLIGKMISVPSKRDELASILVAGLADMPGNLSYIVAHDPSDLNVLWITEVWADETSHTASLSLPSVQQAIQKGRPLIASMERITATKPVGGHGL